MPLYSQGLYLDSALESEGRSYIPPCKFFPIGILYIRLYGIFFVPHSRFYRHSFFPIAGSDFHYSFHHIGHDDSLYVFEAPIDLMSYISMHQENWEAHNYVSCCGTSSTPALSLLSLHPQIKTVFLCLDNDAAGHKACLRMAAQIAEQFEIASDRLSPLGKDWNDDLVAQVKQQQKEVTIPCQTFG